MGRLCYSGLLAIIMGWAAILLSIIFNPWFNTSTNALSDLGALKVENNYFFNVGLVISGIFALTYTV